MTTKTPPAAAGDLSDALDALTAAAALGLHISAPAGTYVYEVTTGAFEDDPSLGIFTTEEAATRALRNHLLYGHDPDDPTPAFLTDRTSTDLPLKTWLDGRTDRDVIDAYYRHYHGEHYAITARVVQGHHVATP